LGIGEHGKEGARGCGQTEGEAAAIIDSVTRAKVGPRCGVLEKLGERAHHHTTFSPMGERMFCASGSGTIHVNSSTILHSHKSLFSSLSCIALSPDGEYYLVTASDTKVRLQTTGKLEDVSAFYQAVYPTPALGFSPDGMRVGIGSADGAIYVSPTKPYSQITDESHTRSGTGKILQLYQSMKNLHTNSGIQHEVLI
jgi:WD40 repeat protein